MLLDTPKPINFASDKILTIALYCAKSIFFFQQFSKSLTDYYCYLNGHWDELGYQPRPLDLES